MKKQILILLSIALTTPFILGAAQTTPSALDKDTTAKALWDSWYTVSIGGKIPFGYYNDRVEKKDGKFAFKNQFWKKEEGFINEERIVAFGKDEPNLPGLLFVFNETFRNSELTLDGSVSDQGELTVKVREKGKPDDVIRRSMGKNAFFSTLFPVWLGKHLDEIRKGKNVYFSSILEDNLERKFAAVPGHAHLETPDAFTKKSGTEKILVDFNDKINYWYIQPSGEPIRIEMPDQKVIVEKTTESLARKFLIPHEE